MPYCPNSLSNALLRKLMEKIRVLFVCLGNICRSPMAEGAFQHYVDEAGLSDRFEIDSAGTSGYHAGERADARMRRTAAGHGVNLTSRSRQFRRQDLTDFDYVLAMDNANHRDIEATKNPGAEYHAEVLMMRKFDPEPDSMDVPDPYWSGQDGFELVYDILMRSNREFLDWLREKHSI